MNIATIDLSCWKGFGGQHYNATAEFNGKTAEVTYKMNEKQAKQFNKIDGTSGAARYRPGNVTQRFWTKDEAIKASVQLILRKWPSVRLIVLRDEHNPNFVAWCYDAKIKKKLDNLHNRAERMYAKTSNPFGRFPKESEKVWSEWDSLIEQITSLDKDLDKDKESGNL